MSSEHEGYLFDETVETGRRKVKIIVDINGIIFKDAEISKRINFNSLYISYGGSNNQQIFLKSKIESTLVGFTNQNEVIQSIKNMSGGASNVILSSIHKNKTKRFVSSGKFLLAILFLLIVGSGLLFYFQFGKIKKSIAKSVPVNVEKSLGENVFKSSVDHSLLIDVPEVKDALHIIFERFKVGLVDQPYQFNFYVIKNEELNAFALPGGYVVIHTGLILAAETPEELAGVIAHEICHVTERHAIERIISSLGIIAVCQVLLGDVSGVAAILVQGAQLISMMQFNQSQETEADVKGYELMKMAKISHLGFIEFFKRAQKKRAEMPEEVKAAMALISTHPPDEKRINTIKKLAESDPYQAEELNIQWDALKEALRKNINK